MSIIELLRLRIQDSNHATDMAHHISPKVFPPTTLKSLESAESKLGFILPGLLRDIYTQVANGGFGPGYGLIGLDDGAHDDLGKSITDLYLLYKQDDPQNPLWHWPDRLVPICHWGCAIYSCIDCSQPTAPVINFDPNQYEEGESWDKSFIPQMSSFNEWIEGWLNGEKFWIYSMDTGLRKRLKKLLGEGKKISAIVLFQKEKLCSLEEARTYIDSLQATLSGEKSAQHRLQRTAALPLENGLGLPEMTLK